MTSLPSESANCPRAVTALLADQRGALLVEYLVVTTVGLTVAVALTALGVQLVGSFFDSLEVLYSHHP